MPKVYVKFPKTGLGNMLLVWAKARLFAHLNNLPIETSSWWGFRWGALIRRERKSRLYRQYFQEPGITNILSNSLKSRSSSIVFDPPVEKLKDLGSTELFIFKKVIDDIDLFGSIRTYREFIREEMYKILHPLRKKELKYLSPPVIAVHIRRGDFVLGNQETSLEYFIRAIEFIRKEYAEELPVTVFSDASVSELNAVLELPSVSLAKPASDIADIINMSQAKILVLSQSSTFSYWAAFLSEALIIIPLHDWQDKIRDPEGGLMELKWHYENEGSGDKLGSALRSLKIKTATV